MSYTLADIKNLPIVDWRALPPLLALNLSRQADNTDWIPDPPGQRNAFQIVTHARGVAFRLLIPPPF